MSICPKNKSSKARRDKRRANWKMAAPNLVKCSKLSDSIETFSILSSCEPDKSSLNSISIIVSNSYYCA